MAAIIQKLKEYFEKRPEVVLAFLFGSRIKGKERTSSDWDIGVYFKPFVYRELETKATYPNESKIWNDLRKITGTETDMVVLNRAKPPLVFSVLNSGEPLVIKNRRLYLDLLHKTHYEALDWWQFTREFFEIRERSKSLSEEDKSFLREHVIFLENELKDLEKFKAMTQKEYIENRDQRRNIERWVENIVMASIDIAKTINASQKRDMPETYRENLFQFALQYATKEEAEELASFADLRNILANEYLDYRWKEISNFITKVPAFYPKFIQKTKQLLA